MRVAALMMVRNEEDILEASIRHNLTVLDSLVVVDHESDDATPGILASLVKEALPIEVRHADWMDLGSRESAARHLEGVLAGGADACVPLDADEFLRMHSRRAFDAAVEAAAREPVLAIPRYTYVPAFDSGGRVLDRLRNARRIATGHAGSGSVIVHRTRAASPDSSADSRNGRAGCDGSAAAPFDVMPGAVAAVAHVPIRSAGQFIAEVAALHVACALVAGSGTEPPFRWHDELAEIKAGRPFTPEQLTLIAANFGVAAGSAIPLTDICWVDDPFLADIRLAYTPPAPPQALGRILALGERIALAIARTTGGM